MPQTQLQAIKSGNRRALAKAITLAESSLESDRQASQQLLEQLLPDTGNSVRVGVSGVPGVGKSTFIESFGLFLAEQGRKVAVLAVDPSSPIAGGSIMGDKTRMEELSRHPNAFIRPSPSSGALGGVAQKTRETMLLCEAAGFDVIIAETVGVGQSEYDVASMVDFFLVLMIPNAGDDLQGIKKGIMELVDGLVINKADGDSVRLAQQSCQHYRNAFHLLRPSDVWSPEVLSCSALNNQGIDEVWALISRYVETTTSSGYFETQRSEQNLAWMRKLIYETIEQRLQGDATLRSIRHATEAAVRDGKITPYAAAKKITANI
jgi:LAO/AO transport system kinase